jgi:C-terminal processing protease CtpA/Prc
MHVTAARSARSLLLCVGAVLACSPSSDAPATRAGLPPAAAPADSAQHEQRRRVLDALAGTLRERYVNPPVAEKAIAAMQERWQSGAYDALTDDKVFAEAVSADLRTASSDQHLALELRRPAEAPPEPKRTDRKFGFGKSERLEGNVAVLPIFGFVPLKGEPEQEQLADSLSSVADADALIVDLRDNNGGRAPTMAMVASYFFEGPPILLLRVERRYDGASYELWTQSELRGTRFGATKPLFVLTSARTFSGGEGLAYELQVRGRAQLVGEATRGGDGLVERRELPGGFALVVPTSIAINGATGQNRKGPVVPDVSVPAEQALAEAHRRALEALAQRGGSRG